MLPQTCFEEVIEPNGAGLTNTIRRAELAAIAAALTHINPPFCHRQSYLTPPN
jgi:hypothetical protein